MRAVSWKAVPASCRMRSGARLIPMRCWPTPPRRARHAALLGDDPKEIQMPVIEARGFH